LLLAHKKCYLSTWLNDDAIKIFFGEITSDILLQDSSTKELSS